MDEKPAISILVHRLVLPTIIIIATLIYYIEVQGLKNPDNRLLISPIFWIMLGLYFLIIWHEIKTWKRINKNWMNDKEGNNEDEDNYDSEMTKPLSKKLLFYIIGIAIYLSLINIFGFVIMTLIFLPSLMLFFGTKSLKILIIIPIAVVLIINFIFINLLSIPFPVWPQF